VGCTGLDADPRSVWLPPSFVATSNAARSETTASVAATPHHVERILGDEEIRRGLNLASWETAQNLIAEWNRAGKVGGDFES